MKHTMSVLVQVDLDATHVRVLVTGCLTEANQHVLHPVIGRARTLGAAVHVDLDSVRHLQPAAATQLRAAVDHEGASPGLGAVRISVPTEPRTHPLGELPVRPLPDSAPLPALAA
ncbi:hypothetical protein [Kocuria sp. CNJ-770]|uniref:hypothetical protein n=1 Tax=Kocuria sp. CNJ-770 TaxID=1904964 RepID=UPI00111542DF|nr:hypothetical protein [Kocuria sp. CNJ-770]